MCGGLRLQCEAQTFGRGSSDSRKKKHAQSVSFETVAERKTLDVFSNKTVAPKRSDQVNFCECKKRVKPLPSARAQYFGFAKSSIVCILFLFYHNIKIG